MKFFPACLVVRGARRLKITQPNFKRLKVPSRRKESALTSSGLNRLRPRNQTRVQSTGTQHAPVRHRACLRHDVMQLCVLCVVSEATENKGSRSISISLFPLMTNPVCLFSSAKKNNSHISHGRMPYGWGGGCLPPPPPVSSKILDPRTANSPLGFCQGQNCPSPSKSQTPLTVYWIHIPLFLHPHHNRCLSLSPSKSDLSARSSELSGDV